MTMGMTLVARTNLQIIRHDIGDLDSWFVLEDLMMLVVLGHGPWYVAMMTE